MQTWPEKRYKIESFENLTSKRKISKIFLQIFQANKTIFLCFFPENNQAIKNSLHPGGKGLFKSWENGWSVVNICSQRNHMASVKAKIRYVFWRYFSMPSRSSCSICKAQWDQSAQCFCFKRGAHASTRYVEAQCSKCSALEQRDCLKIIKIINRACEEKMKSLRKKLQIIFHQNT